MRNIPRSLVAGGVLAASLFLAASPAHAWGGRFRVFARPHVGAHFFARRPNRLVGSTPASTNRMGILIRSSARKTIA